jgi:hypothetical protein|tara:strand:+ start:297 stop:506 length:210 start_codon:yes stop_codon:yes gene_type:complete
VTKIINLKTGLVREQEKKQPVFCELCGVDTNEVKGSVSGNIGQLPVSLCGICVNGILNILVEYQQGGKT